MRPFDADVKLICGGTQSKCRRCRLPAEVIIQLPFPGKTPTEVKLCKPCVADILGDFFHEFPQGD